MTPANEFPGNIIYFVLLVGFLGFFAWAASTRAQWLFKSKPIARVDNLFWRVSGMIPDLLGNRASCGRSTGTAASCTR